jgi:glyoxylase-like metal-dependent hydrolase (beta-lactamase superfamily II)
MGVAMTATIPNNTGAELPDYAPLPASSLGPELNEQGYHVDRVERNLFWVTDSVYLSAFLATAEGVVVFDAPPTIGHNIQRAIDEVTAGEGTTNRVTHLVYSHHHADHSGAASLFPDAVVIGHEDTKRRLVRDADPTRPAPSITFADHYTLEVGGERVVLDHQGPNHTPDNIFIHFPDHETLMLVDVVNPGWVPVFNSNLSEDIPGYIDAPAQALEYPWTKFIAGHMGRLGTRDDLAVHQAFIADIVDASYRALAATDPTPYLTKYWPNHWGWVNGYLDEITRTATKPVVEKYTGVLAAADIEPMTYSTTFMIMQSLRLDRGVGSQVHP